MSKLYESLQNNATVKKIYYSNALSRVIRPFWHTIVRCNYFVTCKIRAFFEYIESIPRALGYKDPRYEAFRQLHNKYKGKRCFITCTGPSLTISDLEMLKDEYVFGMNSICLIHDKTDWKPDFFALQDGLVFNRIKDYILNTDNGLMIFPDTYKKKKLIPQDWVTFHMCGYYHLYEYRFIKTHFFAKFSENAYARVYDGYSIAYSIIQIAVYMGFDELYLLGADCSYSKDKHQHFIDHGQYERNFDTATQRLFAAYEEAKKHSDKLGVKIFNATRGGCLEIFPRVNLDDVVADSRKNKVSK